MATRSLDRTSVAPMVERFPAATWCEGHLIDQDRCRDPERPNPMKMELFRTGTLDGSLRSSAFRLLDSNPLACRMTVSTVTPADEC